MHLVGQLLILGLSGRQRFEANGGDVRVGRRSRLGWVKHHNLSIPYEAIAEGSRSGDPIETDRVKSCTFQFPDSIQPHQ
jgi:hypothetical protein